jgi:hypothetical protein
MTNLQSLALKEYMKHLDGLRLLETIQDAPENTCRYCGMPTEREDEDQYPPTDYCHPEDHLYLK